ncbi:hypothetical protein [Brachybacterium tyrofermentans]|uniref:hypothetical protein n=1 Tax=Brachybacterium tyrofermentans TaxID=47848 RepID=UPI003FD2DCA0
MSTADTTAPADQDQDTATDVQTEEAAPISSAMPDGASACGTCGVPVAPTATRGTVVAEPRRQNLAVYPDGSTVQMGEDTPAITFATCQACADRAALARDIMRAHPGLVARIGPALAVDQLTDALHAFAIIGARVPVAALTADAVLTRLVLDTMPSLGAAVQWLTAYRVGEVTTEQCAAYPFATSTEELRASARAAVGRVLDYQVARSRPDVPLRAPDGRPCLFCGIGEVMMPATHVVVLGGRDDARARAWHHCTTTLHTLGGRASTDQADGHLCHRCERAATATGSLGVAALSRALTEHLRATGQDDAARALDLASRGESLTGLAGHAVVGGGANTAPWEHVRLGEGLAPLGASPARTGGKGRGRAPRRRGGAR